MGNATTRSLERVAAAMGKLASAPTESVNSAGLAATVELVSGNHGPSARLVVYWMVIGLPTSATTLI